MLAALLSVLVAGAPLVPLSAQTVTSAVPAFLSFQGRVTTPAGAIVGAGTPVNRTVTFRIWNHPSDSLAANLLYSEQQVATISEGEFSVLIGQGSATAGAPLGYSETTKGKPTISIADAGVFNSATRYLGVTVDDGNAGTVDPEISPRQQIVTAAFAFRAKYAEQIGTNGRQGGDLGHLASLAHLADELCGWLVKRRHDHCLGGALGDLCDGGGNIK